MNRGVSSNDLKASASCSNVEEHREIAKCTATLLNRLSAIMAARSEGASLVQPGVGNVMLKGGVSRDPKSRTGPGSVGSSSRRHSFGLFLVLANLLNFFFGDFKISGQKRVHLKMYFLFTCKLSVLLFCSYCRQ